ncbi:MAG: flagellar motor protein [Betaproteobacteria bacterium]|nr:flagellar motor protein [Betaproteobacteria bacterium]MDE2622333.1 flagellar motor protein [Betaproteobacteria bacterium]
MEKLSVLGLLIGVAGVVGGQWLEGGAITTLLQGTAFVIVFGGTLGAVMLQTPFQVFVTAVRMSRWVFISPLSPQQGLQGRILEWSNQARREGLLALESQLNKEQDPFIRKGLQLVVDGYSAEKIREVMAVDIQSYEHFRWASARVWEAAAGYAPTIGMLGAVLGLVQVMERLGEPSQLGSGIAVAFISTIYGVGFANLLFLPVANKLKMLIQQQISHYEMLVDGFMLIANGENPHFIQGKLQGYLS